MWARGMKNLIRMWRKRPICDVDALCNLKRRLLCATSLPETVHGRKRLFSTEIWMMIAENRECGNVAQNLHALLFSKFLTQRFILLKCELLSPEETAELDFKIRTRFRERLQQLSSCPVLFNIKNGDLDFGNAKEEAYFSVLDEFYVDSVVRKFRKLDKALSEPNFVNFKDAGADVVEDRFWAGMSLSGGFLVRNLEEDLARLEHCWPGGSHVVQLATRWRFFLTFCSVAICFLCFCHLKFGRNGSAELPSSSLSCS